MASQTAERLDTRADIHDAQLRRRMSPGALRTWFGIAKHWALTDVQAARLLGTPASTYRRWKRRPDVTLDVGQIERLSLLLGIYKGLEMLLPRADAADAWVKRPNSNPIFGGATPLERMLAGHIEDLAIVRRHLDAERGGWA
ncbi:MbcA/ParS/Xre antitoxin family protein [Endozoicomonas sp. G2_2]|uniref:MbcA/ParS/Xre antitoxin family protein n=1 Tax=Endozoicomonas sp. G2_2 TaxID=2821092 RepID=UPI001FFDFB28|nr:MbcA/ParS/Xre antitoxin family protein [Endozoicomonas sp. G2_2]